MAEDPKIIPIGERFENPKAFLARIMEDEGIAKLAVVVVKTDGSLWTAYHQLNSAELSYCGALMQKQALEPTK